MFRSHRIFAVSFHHRRRLFHKKAVANSKVPHVVIIRGIIRGYDSHLAIPTLDDSVEFYTTYCSFLPTIRHFSHLLLHQPILASGATTSQHIKGRGFIWGTVRFFSTITYVQFPRPVYCAVSRIRTRDHVG